MKKLLIFASLLLVIGVLGMMFTFKSLNNHGAGHYNESKVITEDFDNISIDTDTSKILVMKSEDDDTHIEIKNAKNKKTFEYEVEDNTLNVSSGDYMVVNINFGIIDEAKQAQMIIHLPEKQYKKVTLESDVADLKIDELKADFVKINSDTGMIAIDKLSGDTLKMDIDTGEVKLDDVMMKDINFEVDTGQLDMKNVDKDTNIKGDIDTGEANIEYKEKPDNANFNLDADTGDIETNNVVPENGVVGDGKAHVTIQIDMGDLEFDAVK